ncbi:hypothetical protein GPECTOR_4g960 [Gonium pectorale]|uniref:Macrocin O-methyltransferase n=1 Tax=Gonium pectorale TaxID=33097 RepID=A0A150GYY2_GONPE|nr:hypothetical protein GPECTOR_4g960 [Gonium pectorale]|eukprot:KXZ54888.1 hypothetical protein GPECTOR_4g960 [Gonium pectorale]
MKDWNVCGRKYWGFDSFQGLPNPVNEDQQGSLITGAKGQFAAGLEQVKQSFRDFGLEDPTLVELVPGWFNESLPNAAVKHIAFLRLDGDLFASTHDALVHLYSKVVPGGLVYIDDYGGFNGCRLAVDTFRMVHGISSPLHWIVEDEERHHDALHLQLGRVEAVWWRKGGWRDEEWYNP